LFSETLYFIFLLLNNAESSVNIPALRQFNASCETTTTHYDDEEDDEVFDLRKDDEFMKTVMPLI